MNEDEKNFDALRQLLKIKQLETPPPGFFNSFSSQVISRIRADQVKAGQAVAANVPVTSWLASFFQLFEFKPAFAGAFASALCLVLVFGVVYADRPDSVTQPFLQNSDPALNSYAALTPAAMASANYADVMVSSNYPATSLQPVSSIFDSGNAVIQPVGFSPGSN